VYRLGDVPRANASCRRLMCSRRAWMIRICSGASPRPIH
jgi:hypothetical protein